MRKNILVVDSSLLNARTVAMMYETYGCTVALAFDVPGATEVARLDRFDAVVMGPGFCRENGAQLRTALKKAQPGLRIAVFDEHAVSSESVLPGADFHVRPSYFFSDLCRHLSARPEIDEHCP